MTNFHLKKILCILLLIVLYVNKAYAVTSLQTNLGLRGQTGTSQDIVLGNNDFSFNWTERNIGDSKPEKPDELGYDNVDPGLEQPFMLRSTATQKNAVVPDLFFSRVITR